MRISDWSSDVCSSDLPGRPPCRASRTGESAAQHRPERCSCESGSPEPEETALVTLGSCFRRSTRSALEPPRSEEHTSELQSLMRISYAVFCLKKKTILRHIPLRTTAHTSEHTSHIIHTYSVLYIT